MTMEAIKAAIAGLPGPDRRDLVEWLDELEERAWDEEIRRDSAPGRGGAVLADEALRAVAEGKARPIEEGFVGRRNRRA